MLFILILIFIILFAVISGGGKGRGQLSQEDENILSSAPPGLKIETLVRHYFNTHVTKGTFMDFSSVLRDGQDIPNGLPLWLFKVVDGNRIYLDLDGFNNELKIAFEYNGILHYAPADPNIEKDIQSYETKVMNDGIKMQKSRENNVILIIIHYKIHITQLKNYVKSRLSDTGALKAEYMNKFEYINVIPEPARWSRGMNTPSTQPYIMTVPPNVHNKLTKMVYVPKYK